MRSTGVLIVAVCLLVTWVGCKERFDPKITPSQTNYLVVEGVINARGITTMRLSRTVTLKDSSKIKPELNAVVRITGENNATYNLRPTSSGVYVSDDITLNASQKYRLHIKTSSGREYLSAFTPVKRAPAVDSVNWRLESNNAVRIYVNTHNPQNDTRYYKWDYEETWEIHSAFPNSVEYKNGVVIPRPPETLSKLYYCWRNQNSTNILLGSSAKLSDDVISMAPILFIPPNSERISVRYSILIKQYALDRSSYDFYQMMKSNTETLGSIFDALPSETTGNITCVSNPAEKVIGYVIASTVEEKRIFIARTEVPSRYYDFCETTYVPNIPDSIKFYFDTNGLAPYEAVFKGGGIVGYNSSDPFCIDCTLRGSNIKPSFW